ncbi:MAG: putative DNA-binding protein [Ilumatobacteraceae bacterium]|nr:putative DNA-binding protein [Ilumatobacteraceae bacterium]
MDRRAELGEFLRARREALRPSDVGLPAGARRRTPGLRREEIALLAGVSVTWYTWLEQGRRINASRDVLLALARALRLDDAGRDHLLALAHADGRAAEAIDAVIEAPDALQRLIMSMEPAPAYVLGPRWEIVSWNAAEERLYAALRDLEPSERNLLWVMFCEPTARRLIADWEDRARSTLAEFRAGTTMFFDDPLVIELIDRIATASTEFAEWWPQHDVAGFQTRLRRYNHPRAGSLTFEYQQMIPSEWPHLRVICQLPLPGDDSAQRLAAWRDIG